MTQLPSRTARHAILFVAALAATAYADVSGIWVGQLTARRGTPAVSADVTQAGRRVTGTLTVESSDPTLGGVYTIRGAAVGARWRARGSNAAGARLGLHITLAADAANGKLRVGVPGNRVAGRVTLTRRTSGGGAGPSCDAVFTQNQAFFTDQVLGQVLASPCAVCHATGGVAQTSRLLVTTSDPAATARATALLVDPADPAASLLLTKPLALVSHSGGAQLAAGGPQANILQQWVDILVQSGCLTAGGGGSGGGEGDPYSVSCASCHGADAAGTATAPDIRCSVASRITDAVRNGRAAMPAFSVATLDAAALQAITTRLDALCGGQPADVYAANCATCHGADAASVACEDGIADVVRSGGDGMPAFPDLGGARLRALATYVASLCQGGGGGGEEGGD